MKEQAKITSKGQVTVPKRIRQSLGVEPGDSILFEEHGDEVVVRPVRKKNPFEKYRGIGNPGIGSGREAVLREFRELRGHDSED